MKKGFFEKYIKNQFFGHLLTDSNILALVEHFSLEELRIGLIYSNKVIYKRVNSLNYLIKSIQTGVDEVNLSTIKRLERLCKAAKSDYTYEEIYNAYRQAEEDGLNLSCLKLTLLINTLEYQEYLKK